MHTNILSQSWRLLLGVFLAWAGLLLFSTGASAATLYYIGTGTDTTAFNTAGNWKTTDPGACDNGNGNGTVPSTSDTVVFDGDCDTNLTVPENITVTALTLGTGYTGTVTIQNTSTAPFTVSGAVTIASGATLAAQSSTASLRVGGNWANSGTYTANGNTVTFNGTAAQTINTGGVGASNNFYGLRISNTADYVSLVTNHATVGGNFTIDSSGLFDAVAQNLIITGTLSNSGTLRLVGSQTFTVGTVDTDSGNITYNGTSDYATVTPIATYYDLTFSSSDGNAASWTFTAALDVNNALTVTNGSAILGATSDVDGAVVVANDADAVLNIVTYTLNVGGAWTVGASGVFTAGSGSTVTFDSGGAQNVTTGGTDTGHDFHHFTVSGASTAVTLVTNALDIDGTLTINNASGSLDLDSYALTAATLDNTGTLKLDGGQTVTITTPDTNSGTVTYIGGTGAISTTPISVYYNLTFNDADSTWTIGAALDVNGAFTVTAGTVNTSTNAITVAGNWSNAGTVTTTGTVTLDGASAQSLTTGGTGAGNDFQNLTISTSNGVTTLIGALDVDGTLSITGTNVTLDIDTYALTANTLSNNGNLALDGSETVLISTMDIDSGAVIYQGASGTVAYASGLAAGDSYYDLTISASSDTYTLDANLSIAGDFGISTGSVVGGTYTITVGDDTSIGGSGTYTASSSTLNLAGDFTRSGTFTAGTGTVTFSGSGAHTVTGATTFYNLTKTGSGTLSLTAGQAFTISGAFTSTNTSSILNSTSGGSAASMSTGSAVVNTLTVTDITNTGANIRCYPLCTNGGGNTGWLFTAASSTATSGGGGSAPMTLAITSPNGGNSLMGGQESIVTWQTSGTGITSITLEYSKDGGNSYITIASGEVNDGSYTWLTPNISTSAAKVQVKAYADSSLVMSDISDANFSIAISAIPTTQTTTQTQSTTPTTNTIVSMVNSEGVTIHLSSGGLFRGVTLSGVYRVNADGTRSVFPNEATFMSYEKDWANVVTVGDDQLRKLPLGKRVTMNKGALVKIQSDPKVYVIGDNAKLTWVPSEAEAKLQFGADWAKKVKDVSDALWFDYTR